jgi:DNA-binding LacI/PurR family transcriptional regulator
MKKRSRPTIFDLARRTGLSRGTISRAFNNQPGISSKTQEKILRIAKEIGYSPHNGARMMKLGRTKRWGLLLPHLQNPYYSELVEALNTHAQAQETVILLGLSNHDKDRESNLITQWTAGETDGLILDQSHYHSNPELFEQLKAREVPIVFLHGRPIPGFDFVRYQLFDSFTRILNQADALGHTEIGYVGQEFAFCRKTARFRAYVEFHESRGREVSERLIHFGEDGARGGSNAWRAWQSSGNLPTAVVCCDDIIACGVVQAARSSGLQIPRDLSVTGVDDIAEAARQGLTTIFTNRDATAKAIFELLERRLASFDAPPEVREIPSELIMRDSLGRPRQSAPRNSTT